jgi:outer membrane protein OmpA-like peptidoglycan-associated protein
VFPALPVGTYTFSVAAINTAPNLTGTGTGPAATSASLRVTSRPGVPRALTVTPGDRTLALTFQPPASNGGSAITGYYYTADGAKTWHRLTTTGTTTLKATVAPVLNGTSFSVAVLAANANGWSPATPLVTVRTVAWFRDPLTPTQRQQEIAVPKDPTTYRGPLRNTKAAYRSKNGTIAYPASALNGRQLQPTQGVNVLFGFDSSTLTTAGKAQMKAVATSLKYVTAVTCEGYADYSGSAAHELDLSRTRANAVCAAIHTYAPQVTSRTVVAYGRTYPVIVGGTSSQRGGNRRVVILVTR